jgi:hypothetical protein
MMGSVSGNLPWWSTVLIAIVAAAGPLAVFLQNRHHDKAHKDKLKHDAYEQLIAASEIVVFRSAVLAGQRSAGNAIAHSLSDFRKAGVVLSLASATGRPLRKMPEKLKMFVNSIPTPAPIEDAINLKSLQDAFERLIKANIEVNLYGSDDAIGAAEKLINDGKNHYALVQSANWTWSGLPDNKVLMESRDKLKATTSAFVDFKKRVAYQDRQDVNRVAGIKDRP